MATPPSWAGRPQDSSHLGCRAAAQLQKLTRRRLDSASDTSGAASVLIARGEGLRDSQGVREDGRSARFFWAASLRSLRRSIARIVQSDTHLPCRRARSIFVAPYLLASRTSRPPVLPVKSSGTRDDRSESVGPEAAKRSSVTALPGGDTEVSAIRAAAWQPTEDVMNPEGETGLPPFSARHALLVDAAQQLLDAQHVGEAAGAVRVIHGGEQVRLLER